MRGARNSMKYFISFFAALFSFPLFVFANWGSNYMMSGWGMMSGGSVFDWLSSLVWLVVGVLAAVWLWQHIDRK